jgi:hypothetical protein
VARLRHHAPDEALCGAAGCSPWLLTALNSVDIPELPGIKIALVHRLRGLNEGFSWRNLIRRMPTVRLLGSPTFFCLFSQYHSPKAYSRCAVAPVMVQFTTARSSVVLKNQKAKIRMQRDQLG